jgi:hypothetical protein
MSQHNRKDFIWIAVVGTIILAISTIPNWVGYNAQTEELVYKGIFFDPQDYAVHLSMMRAGMQGDWAYQFRYTTESHQKAYIRLFYVALGQLNRLLQIDPASLFVLARWFFGYTALFTIYALTKRFFDKILWQRVAFLLAVFGSGLGWMQLIFGWIPGPITPIDFWLIDAYVFFGIALFPHFAFVTSALCAVLLLYLDYLEKGGWMRIAGSVVIAILTQFVNPIAFVLVDLALATTTLSTWIQKRKIDWQQFTALGVIGLAQLPLLIYNFNLLSNDPIWSQFTLQNETLSPPAIYYLWGFGLLWIFALVGFVSAIRQRNPAQFGAVAWIVTGLLLAYAPFAIQRRFLHGVTIPLAFLSTRGLMLGIQFLSQKSPFFARRTMSVIILAVFLMSLSSIYLILGRSLFLQNRPDKFFYPASLNPALTWLDENASPNDFVLSTVSSGELIAQKTDLRVYIGHPMETLNFAAKSRSVADFFQSQTDPDWLDGTKVTWVLYGPYERSVTNGTKFDDTGLTLVYNSEDVKIYRVDR